MKFQSCVEKNKCSAEIYGIKAQCLVLICCILIDKISILMNSNREREDKFKTYIPSSLYKNNTDLMRFKQRALTFYGPEVN